MNPGAWDCRFSSQPLQTHFLEDFLCVEVTFLSLWNRGSPTSYKDSKQILIFLSTSLGDAFSRKMLNISFALIVNSWSFLICFNFWHSLQNWRLSQLNSWSRYIPNTALPDGELIMLSKPVLLSLQDSSWSLVKLSAMLNVFSWFTLEYLFETPIGGGFFEVSDFTCLFLIIGFFVSWCLVCWLLSDESLLNSGNRSISTRVCWFTGFSSSGTKILLSS